MTQRETITALVDSDEEDFKYLRFDWISIDPGLTEKATQLGEAWKDENTTQRRSKRDLASAFNAVLTAVEVCGGYTRLSLRIPTYDAIYGGKTQRSAAFNREVLDALRWLISKGFLRKVDDRRIIKLKNHDFLYLPYAYTLTQEWRSAISETPLSSTSDIRRNPLSAYIQVREKRLVGKKKGKQRVLKVEVQPPKSEKVKHHLLIKRTEALLTVYDRLMGTVAITHGGACIPSYLTTLTRIFSNGRYEDGGRFYGSMQGWRKDDRRALRFNSEPVVEIDFSSIHPTMLYELQGLHPLDDAYEIDGFERSDVKQAFNILINRRAQKGRSDAQSVVSHLDITHERAAELCERLYERHKPIRRYFNTGFGLQLQRIDSDIMSEVLHWALRAGVPMIPVHDSVIVRSRDSEGAVLAMRDAYIGQLKEHTTELMETVFDVDERTYVEEPFSPSGNGVGIKTIGFTELMDEQLILNLSGNTGATTRLL